MFAYIRHPAGLFFTAGCIFFCCVLATPISGEDMAAVGTSSQQEKKKTRLASIKLGSKRNEFDEMELDEGTMPAWIGPDGLMRVPAAESSLKVDDTNSRSEKDEGIAVPFIYPSSDKNILPQEDRLIQFRKLVQSVHHQARVRPQRGRINAFSPEKKISSKTFPDECSDCYATFLSPSFVYADGSDIFLHDMFDPSDSYPSEFNESNVKLPSSCYLASDYLGHLICSDRLITSVPYDLPRNQAFSILEMNNTNIEVLKRDDFKQMDVVVIKLNGNAINTVEPGAFNEVSSLQSLFLRRNLIQSVDWQQFDGLSELVVLSLRGNRIDMKDSFKKIHIANVSYLPSLTYLDLSENPLGALNEFTFWELQDSPIRELNLKSCELRYIHPAVFEPLTSLLHIDFYNNSGLMPIFMDENRAPTLPPFILQLGLGFNWLVERIPSPLFKNSTESLKVLNLSGNLFFVLTDSVLPASVFPNLRAVALESCSISFVSETAFQNMSQLTYLYLGKNQLTQVAPRAFPRSLELLSIRQNPQVIGMFSLTKENLEDLSELVWLDMNFMKLDGANLSSDVFSGLRKLNILQMRHSDLSEIPGKIFAPLSELLMLDLGDNTALTTLPADFSFGLNNLKMIFLDSCSLDFPNDKHGHYQPFSWMTNLEWLYLNRNKINVFPSSMMINLTQLYVLHLGDNQILTWQLGTTAYMSGGAIDVSNNRISFLPNQTYEEFSRISAIDLSDNAFTCSCPILDLQRLANSTTTEVLNWKTELAYICMDTSVDPPFKEIPYMSEEEFYCEKIDQPPTADPDPGNPNEDDTMTIVSSVVGAILIVIVLVGTVGGCYWKRNNRTHKWFYFRQHALNSLDFKTVDDENDNEYEYDAFISFNEQDRHWVYTYLVPKLEPPKDSTNSIDSILTEQEPSFRLCLHDRDFTVGQQITDNIIENIAKSRKVVIVLSRSYVESKWCQFELHLSQHRLLESERRDALVLILLEDVPKQQQNAGLRYLLTTRTYLAWRNDLEGQRLFWQRLRQVLTVRHHKDSSTSSHQSVTLRVST